MVLKKILLQIEESQKTETKKHLNPNKKTIFLKYEALKNKEFECLKNYDLHIKEDFQYKLKDDCSSSSESNIEEQNNSPVKMPTRKVISIQNRPTSLLKKESQKSYQQLPIETLIKNRPVSFMPIKASTNGCNQQKPGLGHPLLQSIPKQPPLKQPTVFAPLKHNSGSRPYPYPKLLVSNNVPIKTLPVQPHKTHQVDTTKTVSPNKSCKNIQKYKIPLEINSENILDIARYLDDSEATESTEE